MMRLYRTLARTIALLAVLALFGGCGRIGPPSHRVGNMTLSDAEFRYGIAPKPNSSVVYQDDVVIVGRGAEAVRFASSNGLTWTIDAHAPRAQELTPGKIMFLTNRAVGRVLGVRQNGDNLAVTLGPVALTDVIKEAHVSFDQPVDLNAMIAYTAPDFPGAVVQLPKTSLHRGPIQFPPTPLIALAADSPPTLPEPTVGPPRQIDITDFKVTPFCCGGLGIEIVHKEGGLKVLARAILRLQAPSLHFDLDITGGTVRTAAIVLTGAAGLNWVFEVASETGVEGNISKEIAVPVDLSLPISGLTVPIAVTLHQAFIIKTGFSARNSVLRAKGTYNFSGAISIGYRGSWSASAPLQFVVTDSLIGTQGGASLGATGLVLAYQGKVIVGIGAFGFATGPYFGYNTAMGIVQGSDAAGVALGLPKCRAAYLKIDLETAIGYKIPEPVTSAINFFLRQLNIGEIKSFGGFPNPPYSVTVKDLHESIPARCA